MIDILIDVLLFCVIFAVIYWVINKFLVDPARAIAIAILMVIAVIFIIAYARPLLHQAAAPHSYSLPRR